MDDWSNSNHSPHIFRHIRNNKPPSRSSSCLQLPVRQPFRFRPLHRDKRDVPRSLPWGDQNHSPICSCPEYTGLGRCLELEVGTSTRLVSRAPAWCRRRNVAGGLDVLHSSGKNTARNRTYCHYRKFLERRTNLLQAVYSTQQARCR